MAHYNTNPRERQGALVTKITLAATKGEFSQRKTPLDFSIAKVYNLSKCRGYDPRNPQRKKEVIVGSSKILKVWAM